MKLLTLSVAAALLSLTASAQAPTSPRIYNTIKQKLAAGKQVFGGTVLTSDPELYCSMANAGWDFLWIEMQHSPLTFPQVAQMIRGCKGSSAMPFIRVPTDSEGDIQKATDIGAVGIIVPMVESVEKIQNAVKFAKYPPMGKRSQGNGQYGEIWGRDYRQTANDNVMIVAMIESPAGAAIADKIAAVPGVDVVFVASTDLGSFSGKRQGDPEYEALVTRIHDATLKAGRKVGGPDAWRTRQGFSFFQGPPDTALVRLGTQQSLGLTPAAAPRPTVAPTEGSEH